MPKHKLVFLLSYVGAGGGVRTVLETTNRLTERGHEVYIMNPGGCRASFMPQFARSLSMPGDRGCGPDVPAKHMEFDAVINQDPATFCWSKVLKAKKKILHVCSGFPTAYELFKKDPFSYDHVTACNRKLQEEWNATYVGQGVNLTQFYPVEGPENVVSFCSRGGFKEWNAKGGKTLAEALPHVTKELRFWGWDTDRHAELDAYGISEWSSYPLHGNMTQGIYAQCEIVVAPDNVSAWNCVAGEAMATGKVIIASDQGTEDYLEHEENALIFKAGDSKHLAEHLNRVAKDKDLKKKLKANAIETSKKWSWDGVIDRWERFFKEIL